MIPVLPTFHRTAIVLALAALVTIAGCQPSAPEQPVSPYVTGLRSAIYPVGDLDRARAWYSDALGIDPYFDQPFYVGFDIAGFEVGLDPDTSEIKPGPDGVVAYWRVRNINETYDHLLSIGATPLTQIEDAGGVVYARVADPFGNTIGIMADAPVEERQ